MNSELNCYYIPKLPKLLGTQQQNGDGSGHGGWYLSDIMLKQRMVPLTYKVEAMGIYLDKRRGIIRTLIF